ncbi:hypothetical protein [Rhodoferax sp. PAMC 29310]|uniref:hypothetical protein n=1 Tax=Rhodoferax sp. PAMC 29310 TaxID=2822760 RepID=UPI001B32CCB2|nr:hypothetical protein [Rhodoferax sp. PAMC 29310]
MAAQTTSTLPLWWGSVQHIAQALQNAASVRWQSDPHADGPLAQLLRLLTQANPHCAVGPQLRSCTFEPVSTYCRSFSEWWKKAQLSDTPQISLPAQQKMRLWPQLGTAPKLQESDAMRCSRLTSS